MKYERQTTMKSCAMYVLVVVVFFLQACSTGCATVSSDYSRDWLLSLRLEEKSLKEAVNAVCEARRNAYTVLSQGRAFTLLIEPLSINTQKKKMSIDWKNVTVHRALEDIVRHFEVELEYRDWVYRIKDPIYDNSIENNNTTTSPSHIGKEVKHSYN